MDRDEANGDEMFLLDPKCDQHCLNRCDGNCAGCCWDNFFFVSFNYYCRHSHRYCQCYSHYCHHHHYYCHYFCCAKKVHIMKLWKPWAFWFDTVRSIMYWPITKKIRIICYWWRSGFLTPYKSGLFRWNTIPFHRNFRCSWFLRHLLEI